MTYNKYTFVGQYSYSVLTMGTYDRNHAQTLTEIQHNLPMGALDYYTLCEPSRVTVLQHTGSLKDLSLCENYVS